MTIIVEFVEERAGIHFRSIFIPFRGTTIPQHVHGEAHATYCGCGKARLYVDGLFQQDLEAGHSITVEAGKQHMFETLEDNTRLACVWSVEAAERELKRLGY